MNRRDQELLDKQLHAIYPPPRHDGVIMLGILTVFFAGMALGGFLDAFTSEPTRIAMTDSTPTISIPYATPATSR